MYSVVTEMGSTVEREILATKKFGEIFQNDYPLNFEKLYFGDLQSWSTYDVTLSATCDVCLALRG